jgi:hypothetical protein
LAYSVSRTEIVGVDFLHEIKINVRVLQIVNGTTIRIAGSTPIKNRFPAPRRGQPARILRVPNIFVKTAPYPRDAVSLVGRKQRL